jgi:hypothetical protein
MGIVDERGKSYGPVKRGGNISRTAALWSAYLGVPITDHDCAWMMVLLKASRSKQDPGNMDNFLDAHGYLDIAEQLR